MEKLVFARRRTEVKECPCGKSNRDGKFAPYLIANLPSEQYGFCHSCSETFLPKREASEERFYRNAMSGNRNARRHALRNKASCYGSWRGIYRNAKVPVTVGLRNADRNTENAVTINNPGAFISQESVEPTLSHYRQNPFISWLHSFLPYTDVERAVRQFLIATGKHSATLFWYIDRQNRFRNAKRIRYGTDGHRLKAYKPYFLFKEADGYLPCLFGEHQLSEYSEEATIVLVESEKTAIIGFIHFPQYIWLATGGTSGLTEEKAQPLAGRCVIPLPDCDGPGRKAALRNTEILSSLGCSVQTLELDITRTDGLDAADFLSSLALLKTG